MLKTAGAISGGLGSVLVLAIVVAVVGSPAMGSAEPSSHDRGPDYAALSVDVPFGYLGLYLAAAATCPGLDPMVLMAIGKIETDHGRHPTMISYAGALGPMQFMPATWGSYGSDGNRDGVADIWDPADAIHSAANYLCAAGAGRPETLRDAIWAYNHSNAYVEAVLDQAAAYRSLLGAPTSGYRQVLSALLSHPNFEASAVVISDFASGRMDGRLVTLLHQLVQRHSLLVTVAVTGHSKYVRGTTSVSEHYYGRAVDIFRVDGESTAGFESDTPRTCGVVAALVALPAGHPLRPQEVGSPCATYDPLPGFFTDDDHQGPPGWRGAPGHIHIGFEAWTS